MTKQSKKHILSLILMTSSILLLLVFQYFWLGQVYENEKRNLQKETNILFFDIMSSLQDSMIQKSIKSAKIGDSTVNFKHFSFSDFSSQFPPPLFQQDSINNKKGRQALHIQTHTVAKHSITLRFSNDSANNTQKNRTVILPKGKLVKDTIQVVDNANIQLFITSDKPQDSIQQILKTIIKNKSQLPPQTQSFVIRLDGDTISEKTVRHNYQKALSKANFALDFELKKIQGGLQTQPDILPAKEVLQPDKGMITAPFVCIPPSPIYQAYFPEYQSFIFRNMISPFLLSLILLVLTSGAFLLIYSNLQKQQKLTALKNDFISNVTHELKTPITTVSVAIEALQSFNALQNPALTKEYLEISKNELGRLSMLVDKIMKMSAFESQGIALKLSKIDLQQLINQVLSSMKLQFEKQGAEVSFVVEGSSMSEKPIINADEVHLTNLIYNLLDNALKYSKENPNINIYLQDLADKVVLAVKDNGIGFAPEYKEKIFDKFFRVPTGNLHNTKGYGLGLSYVASVIHAHGGKIEVESKEGEGSCFRVFLMKNLDNAG